MQMSRLQSLISPHLTLFIRQSDSIGTSQIMFSLNSSNVRNDGAGESKGTLCLIELSTGRCSKYSLSMANGVIKLRVASCMSMTTCCHLLRWTYSQLQLATLSLTMLSLCAFLLSWLWSTLPLYSRTSSLSGLTFARKFLTNQFKFKFQSRGLTPNRISINPLCTLQIGTASGIQQFAKGMHFAGVVSIDLTRALVALLAPILGHCNREHHIDPRLPLRGVVS